MAIRESWIPGLGWSYRVTGDKPFRRHTTREAAEEVEAELAAEVDMAVARRAAEAVNRGDADEADRIVSATSDPQAHAFAAFRFIDVDGDR